MPLMTVDETLAVLNRAQDERGHRLEDDSPGGISSVQRWTCQNCGGAILRFAGNVYGSALSSVCSRVSS